jgi:hypothetical protein
MDSMVDSTACMATQPDTRFMCARIQARASVWSSARLSADDDMQGHHRQDRRGCRQHTYILTRAGGTGKGDPPDYAVFPVHCVRTWACCASIVVVAAALFLKQVM